MGRRYLIVEGRCLGGGIENGHYGSLSLPCPQGDVIDLIRLFHRLEMDEVDLLRPGKGFCGDRARRAARGMPSGLSAWTTLSDGLGRAGSRRDVDRAIEGLISSGRRTSPDLVLSMRELADHRLAAARISDIIRSDDVSASASGTRPPRLD